MTNQELYNLAGIQLNLIESGASLSTQDSNDMMRIMNEMMAAMVVSDMDMNYFPQDTLSATSPIPVWAEKAIPSMFAVDASAEFNTVPSPVVLKKASEGEELIGRTLMNHNLEQADMTHLNQGRNINYNNITDG